MGDSFELLLNLAPFAALLLTFLFGWRSKFLGLLIFAFVFLPTAFIWIAANAYYRLTADFEIGEFTVLDDDPDTKTYQVIFRRADSEEVVSTSPTKCVVQGDYFMVAVWVYSWKEWANVLGLQNAYEVTQIVNFYDDPPNGAIITSCKVIDEKMPLVGKSISKFVAELAFNTSAYDRQGGQAPYMPLVDGATYTLAMDPQLPTLIPKNNIAEAASEKR